MLKTREDALREQLMRIGKQKQEDGKGKEIVPKDTSPPVAQKTKKERGKRSEHLRVNRDPSIFYAGKSHKKYKQQQVIDVLVAADGAISVAAKTLHTSYRQLKRYVEENEKMCEVIAAIEESMLDISESTLRWHIEEERNLTATIFYLKTKGKGRGYVEDEKRDQMNKMQPVNIIFHSPRDPALLAAQQKQLEAKNIDIASTDAATPASATKQTTEQEQ